MSNKIMEFHFYSIFYFYTIYLNSIFTLHIADLLRSDPRNKKTFSPFFRVYSPAWCIEAAVQKRCAYYLGLVFVKHLWRALILNVFLILDVLDVLNRSFYAAAWRTEVYPGLRQFGRWWPLYRHLTASSC